MTEEEDPRSLRLLASLMGAIESTRNLTSEAPSFSAGDVSTLLADINDRLAGIELALRADLGQYEEFEQVRRALIAELNA